MMQSYGGFEVPPSNLQEKGLQAMGDFFLSRALLETNENATMGRPQRVALTPSPKPSSTAASLTLLSYLMVLQQLATANFAGNIFVGAPFCAKHFASQSVHHIKLWP